jgi:hypothetical protein
MQALPAPSRRGQATPTCGPPQDHLEGDVEIRGGADAPKNATRPDGDIAVQAVAHFMLFEEAIERKERGGPERCPSCGSYRVVGHEDFDLDNETTTQLRLCEACDWQEVYEPEPLGPPPPPPKLPDGDCVIRNDRRRHRRAVGPRLPL